MTVLKQFEPIILVSRKEFAGRSSVLIIQKIQREKQEVLCETLTDLVVGLLGGVSRCCNRTISKAYFNVPIQD